MLNAHKHNMEKTMDNKQAVIVRTYSAGAHFGYLVSREGKEVKLERSRRIWSWQSAPGGPKLLSLSEVATYGVGPSSRIGVPVTITLIDAIEVIEASDAAAKNLDGFSNG
jgi:hypothetical protein